jgi:hypothetical protein
VTVRLDDQDATAVVQLLQAAARPGFAPMPPFVRVEFHDDLDDENDGYRHAVFLPLERARALAAVLRSTARLADLARDTG